MVKTLPVSKVIEMLKCIQEDVGDLPIVMSSDSEGNSFSTFDPDFDIECNSEVNNGIIVLYPYSEGHDIDEIEGYTPEDEEVEFDCD